MTSPSLAKHNFRMSMCCYFDALDPWPTPLASLTLHLGLDTGCLFCLGRLFRATGSLFGMRASTGVRAFVSWSHSESRGIRIGCVHGVHAAPPVPGGQVAGSEPADRLTRNAPAPCARGGVCARTSSSSEPQSDRQPSTISAPNGDGAAKILS